MPRMLLDIQNRGQLAAGMSTYHPHRKQLIDTYKDVGTVCEVFRMNHRAKYESLMKEYRRPGGDRPRPLRHLRRRRSQLRPALRAAPHQEAQVVQLRLQRPVGELREAAQRASGRRQQPSGPRDRYRGLHAPDLHGAVGRPPAAAGRRHAADRRRSSTAPTAWSFSTPWAT